MLAACHIVHVMGLDFLLLVLPCAGFLYLSVCYVLQGSFYICDWTGCRPFFKDFSISTSPGSQLKFSDNKTVEGRENGGTMKGYGMVEPDSAKEIAAGWSGRNPTGTKLSRH